MRARSLGLVGLLFSMMLMPTVANGQLNVPPMDPQVPLPIYNTRPEQGGFYFAGEALLFQMDSPLRPQKIATHGLTDVTGTITGTPGQYVGSGQTALETTTGGSNNLTTGFNLVAGYRLQNGIAIEFNWMHLMPTGFTYNTTPPPYGIQYTPNWADGVISAPVVGAPSDYAGNPKNVIPGGPYATYGIWNAADSMCINYEQKFDQVDLHFRQPIIENEAYRWYGILGGRFIYLRERFDWTTFDADLNGVSTPETTANYTNKVANQMFGPKIGWGNEYYLGHGFALTIDLEAALLANIVSAWARYELACGCEDAPSAFFKKTSYTVVPELEAKLNLWWYPIEGVQLRIGYDAMLLFNTVSARRPIDFNYNNLNPGYSRATRFLDGFNIGIGFIF